MYKDVLVVVRTRLTLNLFVMTSGKLKIPDDPETPKDTQFDPLKYSTKTAVCDDICIEFARTLFANIISTPVA